jgi:hypothetical protein
MIPRRDLTRAGAGRLVTALVEAVGWGRPGPPDGRKALGDGRRGPARAPSPLQGRGRAPSSLQERGRAPSPLLGSFPLSVPCILLRPLHPLAAPSPARGRGLCAGGGRRVDPRELALASPARGCSGCKRTQGIAHGARRAEAAMPDGRKHPPGSFRFRPEAYGRRRRAEASDGRCPASWTGSPLQGSERARFDQVLLSFSVSSRDALRPGPAGHRPWSPTGGSRSTGSKGPRLVAVGRWRWRRGGKQI